MSEDSTESAQPQSLTPWLWGLPLATGLWVATYAHLTDFADLMVALLGFTRDTHVGEAVHFFLYDTPKVLLLLTGIVFVMGVVQTFFAPERTRALLAGRRLGVGNALAASLGIVTPFCSCSAVPLFIGFLSAGVPAGGDLFLPDRRAHGQRDRAGPAAGAVRLEGGGPVSGAGAAGGHRRRADHRAS